VSEGEREHKEEALGDACGGAGCRGRGREAGQESAGAVLQAVVVGERDRERVALATREPKGLREG
jgi:hypothetical protein